MKHQRGSKARKGRPKGDSAMQAAGSHAEDGSKAAAELVNRLVAQGVTRCKVGGFDVDGVLRGKYVSLTKLASAIKKGFGFCDVIFGWDIADELYDNAAVTGWATGYPDALAVIDADTFRLIPWEPNVTSVLCDFRDSTGQEHPACPRSLLKRVEGRARDMGFETLCGVEFEFFFFRETRDSLQEKGFRGIQPLDPGMFGYSWQRTGQDASLVRDIHSQLDAFGIDIEALHTETGPGVYEVALAATSAVRAADQAAMFKTSLKQLAHHHGLSVTFMAKWKAGLPGCSGHLHQSLWKGGKNAFHDTRAARGMSRTMRQYVAGLLRSMREFTAFYAPTINSYKRYTPGLWAPLNATWGFENRTCALRVIGTSEGDAARVECRQPGADINPHIALAASLGAGLWGIQQGLELGAAVEGDAGDASGDALPRTLDEAVGCLQNGSIAKQVLGEAFVDHFARTRAWEVRRYNQAVTDWERARYFELV